MTLPPREPRPTNPHLSLSPIPPIPLPHPLPTPRRPAIRRRCLLHHTRRSAPLTIAYPVQNLTSSPHLSIPTCKKTPTPNSAQKSDAGPPLGPRENRAVGRAHHRGAAAGHERRYRVRLCPRLSLRPLLHAHPLRASLPLGLVLAHSRTHLPLCLSRTPTHCFRPFPWASPSPNHYVRPLPHTALMLSPPTPSPTHQVPSHHSDVRHDSPRPRRRVHGCCQVRPITHACACACAENVLSRLTSVTHHPQPTTRRTPVPGPPAGLPLCPAVGVWRRN